MKKKVQCEASPPSSISSVRRHFWFEAKRFPNGCDCPRRKGTRGCIPAAVNKTVGSFSGISEALGIAECFFSLKNLRYASTSFFEFHIKKTNLSWIADLFRRENN